MIFLLIILLLLQLLTYLIIRGGTMNKSPQEIKDEQDAESKWLKEQNEKKQYLSDALLISVFLKNV